MGDRIDELTARPVVGRPYLVPTIKYEYCGIRAAWPVIGPKHSDADHFPDFPWPHYHVDVRFISRRREDLLLLQPHRFTDIFEVVQARPLCCFDDDRKPIPFPAIVYHSRVCRRVRAPYSFGWTPQVNGICRHYAGQEAPLVGGIRVCPHRGAPLSSLAPDADGCVTCPLHGLRFGPDWRAMPEVPR